MSVEFAVDGMSDMCNVDDAKEDFKIREYLKQVDQKYYYRLVENRKKLFKVFPHCGEDGRLFLNTYQYVNITRKNK
ncbi:hypothetical protein [Phascolarctobacterium sp.]|uniref:hypothetical protein n=1 Tax=Phascolarctobacterium sp. TaxID=2049039 RepID=UPI00386EB269